jgi:hypothetical protein
MRRLFKSPSLWGAFALTAVLLFSGAAGATKYYVVVRGIDEAEGVHSGVTAEAQKLFVDELKRHAELTLDPPPGLPTEGDALKSALRAKKMSALEVTLRILAVRSSVKPPAPGKQYRTLFRGIKLSVFGDTLPDKVMAIGGDGESDVGTEIGAHADEDKEGKPLLLDATKEAIKQAVDMTVAKLKLNDRAGSKKKR